MEVKVRTVLRAQPKEPVHLQSIASEAELEKVEYHPSTRVRYLATERIGLNVLAWRVGLRSWASAIVVISANHPV